MQQKVGLTIKIIKNWNSEGTLCRAFGGSGNDEISTASFVKGSSGNDVIRFNDNCCVAFGDSGHDEIRGGDFGIEAHGGSGNEKLVGGDGENDLFGDKGDDTLTGKGREAGSFDCGSGIDTITDFNAAEGDTKTADCENLLNDISASNDDNATTDNLSTPSNETAVESLMFTNEDAASDALTTAMITTMTRSSNNETTTTPERMELE
jgi:Ca2+-binding RTX toxin-like protein